MSENLNNAEKEFLEIFRHYQTITGGSISKKNILDALRSRKYMSPANYTDLENVMNSLVSKGFIEIEDPDCIVLTQLGEDYLWRR